MSEATAAQPLQAPDFDRHLREHGVAALRRRTPTTLQINVGKLCNQACHHCHVEAGPGRKEIMSPETVERLLVLLEASDGVTGIDVTGGAPEMNPSFRRLVGRARELGRAVTVRSNLTVLELPDQADTIDWFAAQGVGVVASLPCYTAENVDKQRGDGVFDASINALRRLNAAGFGSADGPLTLDLVYNPLGAFLPGAQAGLETAYKKQLDEHFGIRFNRLYTITNMPIKRFAEDLARQGKTAEYQQLLIENFNASTCDELMCRDLVSVSWDGALFDCDFNQMLELPLGVASENPPRTIWDLDELATLEGAAIRTAAHCFGCTAGAGSSCGGSLT